MVSGHGRVGQLADARKRANKAEAKLDGLSKELRRVKAARVASAAQLRAATRAEAERRHAAEAELQVTSMACSWGPGPTAAAGPHAVNFESGQLTAAPYICTLRLQVAKSEVGRLLKELRASQVRHVLLMKVHCVRRLRSHSNSPMLSPPSGYSS